MHWEADSLKRSMKMFGALLITLSCITPAASVFIIAPGVVKQAGTGALPSFLIAAIVCIFTAMIYAELSSAFPTAGGEYSIVGRVLGPFAGFIVLGLNLFTITLIVAVIALGIGNYVGAVLPGISQVTAGVATVIVTTLFGILNIRVNAIITGAFLAVELLVLALVAWLGFLNAERPIADFLFHPVFMNSDGVLELASPHIIGLATAVAIFAYNGYGQAVYLSEEMHDAPYCIGRTIIWALLITVVTEVVPVTAMLQGAPDLKNLFASDNMLTDFIASRGGQTAALIAGLGIALAILNANIATILMLARQFFSTGRDHVWPHAINYALTRVHKRYHSPWVATLLCGALAVGACFIDLDFLLVMTSTSIIVVYAALCIAVIVGRRKGITKHSGHPMAFYPLPPMLGLAALGYVTYANYLDEAVGRPSLWVTCAMAALSAAYYFLVLRRKGIWQLRDPVAQIESLETTE